ncbi:MAG: exopolysaccharide biosynthesis protein [Rhizobiales bacterium]|nr:exopolysaccharide biosynthesis protein [Hyphomicrobiales bacterium]
MIVNETHGDNISVDDFGDVLSTRGYGPLLVGPAIITILPTGAIPGVPDICALLIIFISVQILIGRARPWIPKKLNNFSMKREKYIRVVNQAKPYTKIIDRYLYPRLKFLTREELQPIIALVSILLSLAIMVLSFIPFMAAIPAAGILLLGLGLSSRDGLLLLLSFAVFFISASIIPFAWSILT